jgi:hypothetical protein
MEIGCAISSKQIRYADGALKMRALLCFPLYSLLLAFLIDIAVGV